MEHGDAQLIRTRYLNMRGVTRKQWPQYWRSKLELVERVRRLFVRR